MTTPFGFWTIPTLNISLCAVPKSGSTMNRQIVSKAANLISPENGTCYYDWENKLASQTKLVNTKYSDFTTNIAIIRDPWDRAISSFSDQIQRRHIPHNTSFSNFIILLPT